MYKIPDSWQWTKLLKIISVSKETTTDFSNKDLKYIGLEDMKTNGGIISFGNVEKIKSAKNVFKTGQILYGKLRPYLNKHDIAKFDGLCSTDIMVLNNRKDMVEVKYINYYFDYNKFIDYVVYNSRGITLPRITKDVLLNAECPLPPLDEQKRIVEKIESLFSKLDRANENLKSIVGFNDIKNTTLGKIDLMKKTILARAFHGEL